MAELTGKTILVTGAAQGIGLSIARLFADRGAQLVLVDRDEIDLSQLPSDATARVSTHRVDISRVAELQRLADRVGAEVGHLDGIVHAAALLRRRSSIDEVTEEDFDLQYAVNLKGTFFLVAKLRPLVVSGGSIVLFTSQGWWTGGLGGSLPYSATKAGVVAMTRGFAREFAADGVRVNAVAPGFVDTRMMHEGLTAQREAELLDLVPLGRLADPEEVARTAAFLVSEESSYITGATLNVTGGQLVY